MDAILNELECGDLIPIFKNNHIDLETFSQLTDSELKELVQSVGQRKKIKAKILAINEENLNNLQGAVLGEKLTETVNSSSAVSFDSTSTTDVSILDDTQITTNTPCYDLCHAVDLFFATVRPSLPEFDLSTLLQTTPLGNSVLVYYKVNKHLNDTHRTRLVDIICKHIYTFIINHRLKENDYLVLAAKIIALFPKEVVGTYFVPAIRKKDSRTGKSILPKGRLVSKVNNLVNVSGEAAPIRKRKSDSAKSNEDTAVLKKTLKEPNFDAYDNSEDVVWLKHNSEPWATVLEKWNLTYEIRKNTSTTTISDLIHHWPILRDLRANVLINQDFEKLYPACGLKLYLNWDSFFETILNLNEKQLKDEPLNLVKTWRECENEDGKRALELTILPYLIPPKGRHIIDKHNHWKFSTLEVIESIIVHVETPGDITAAINKQIEKSKARKQTVQPYLMVEGPTIYNPRCFYVIIDTLRYQFEQLSKAFDILFKSIHTLNACYPVQSEYLYTLIQKCVYGITTPFDKVTPSTEQVMHAYFSSKQEETVNIENQPIAGTSKVL